MKAGLVCPYSWNMPPGIAWAVQTVPQNQNWQISTRRDASPRSQPAANIRQGGPWDGSSCRPDVSPTVTTTEGWQALYLFDLGVNGERATAIAGMLLRQDQLGGIWEIIL